MKSKKKAKVVVNNGIKSYGQMNTKTNKVEINVKKHKGDKKELANTIKHELLHVKHPKMTEKEVYKKAKRMSSKEETNMLAKLRHKKMNYKMGATKRKLHISRSEKLRPGDLITRSKNLTRAQKDSFAGLV